MLLVDQIHYIFVRLLFRFLVDASDVILENVEQEGLFRKSGAVSRQKELKVCFKLNLKL